MKKNMKNKLFKNYISFLIPLFLLEILFRILFKMPIIDWAILRILISCNIFSLGISFISLFFKDSLEKAISIFLFLITTIYAILQAGFKNFLGVYISLGTSSQLGAVKDYIKDYFDSFSPWFYTMAIPFLLYTCYKLFLEKRLFKAYYKEKGSLFSKKINRKASIISLILMLVLSGIYYETLSLDFMQNKIQLESTKTLFKNPSNPNISVNQFGISLFGLLDIKTTLLKPEEENIQYFEKEEEEKEKTDFTRVIDDTNWIQLDNETTNASYKTLNSYFMSRNITDKNEYTGLFKDKNLIVIMMESVNEIFIHPEYYPTFYKLYTEGWSFTNAYSPRNSCSTGNNEMSGMISLFSIYRTCTANKYKTNEYDESIFNLFNQAGYKTSSYHNYSEAYYYRSTIHKNMKSGQFYGANDLGISFTSEYKEWPSDIALMESALEKIDTENPFMAWLTTVTSHQPYSVSSEFGDKYLDLFTDTNYSISIRRYMSKLKELDLALERLLEILEEKNILENTVIVFFGDHYPYGIPTKEINAVLDYDVIDKNNVDKTPFIIYNSELEPKTFSQYTSYINILPTIANLFDLEYDPRLYIGEDILSPDYSSSYKNRVILADGSWETEIGAYDAMNGTMTYFGEETYTNDEIIFYNKEISDMIKMSNLAITSNYFKYLSDGLQSYNNDEES